MIAVTAANGKDRCTLCMNDTAVANVELGNCLFKLCHDCANTLLENLKGKEVANNAE